MEARALALVIFVLVAASAARVLLVWETPRTRVRSSEVFGNVALDRRAGCNLLQRLGLRIIADTWRLACFLRLRR